MVLDIRSIIEFIFINSGAVEGVFTGFSKYAEVGTLPNQKQPP